jgi:peptidoglycan/xylan/chitin deacetylase (PgdA/CDA1 family)
MLKKKSKKNIRHRLTHSHVAFVGIGILSLLLLYRYFPYYIFFSHHNVAESKKTDLKEIPQEVKVKYPSIVAQISYEIPILMYHYVEYPKDTRDTIRQSLNIYPHVFEAQLKTLIAGGYTFMTMAEVADVLDGKKALPSKPVVLTFDDGYRDFYSDVFPIIKKYKEVKVVTYLTPGLFDRPNYLLSSQVKELSKYPSIELGAHTMHHVYLKDMPSLFAYKEIIGSKYMLEDLIHKPVVSFAYPYGAFDNNVIDLTKKAAFKTAVSTIPGVTLTESNRYFIFRLRPGYMTGPDLTSFVDNPSFGR